MLKMYLIVVAFKGAMDKPEGSLSREKGSTFGFETDLSRPEYFQDSQPRPQGDFPWLWVGMEKRPGHEVAR